MNDHPSVEQHLALFTAVPQISLPLEKSKHPSRSFLLLCKQLGDRAIISASAEHYIIPRKHPNPLRHADENAGCRRRPPLWLSLGKPMTFSHDSYTLEKRTLSLES